MSNLFDNSLKERDTNAKSQMPSADTPILGCLSGVSSEENGMSERPKNGADRRSRLGSGPVDALASRVLSVVANRAEEARSQFHTHLLTAY